MGSPLRPVDPRADFPALEARVLERWRQRDVFAQSLGAPSRRARAGGSTRGPRQPTVLRALSRALPRRSRTSSLALKRCRGHYVERKGGWDCHGLPVELAVETELGFTRKDDIERYGIAEFNARCREKVFSHVEEWNRLTERIGFWIDLDDAYRTLDPDLHRVGVVGAEDHPRQGPALRAPQGRALLPPRRDDAVQPRARPARRLQRRRRPVGLRAPAAVEGKGDGRPGEAAWCGRPRRGRSSPTWRSPCDPDLTYVRAGVDGGR